MLINLLASLGGTLSILALCFVLLADKCRTHLRSFLPRGNFPACQKVKFKRCVYVCECVRACACLSSALCLMAEPLSQMLCCKSENMSIQFTLPEWGLIANYTNQSATAVQAAGSAAAFVGGSGQKTNISEGVKSFHHRAASRPDGNVPVTKTKICHFQLQPHFLSGGLPLNSWWCQRSGFLKCN